MGLGLEANQLYAVWREVNALYQAWRSMHRRCENPDVRDYQWYGARGISVCSRWSDFVLFLEDMWPRPAGMTLDRQDVDGNYEPGNVRWADSVTQANNRRPVKYRRQVPPGSKFGRLVVVEETDPLIGGRLGGIARHRAFVCRCACGVEVIVKMSNLVYGQTKSCGCLKREVSAEHMRRVRHG